MSTEHDWNVHIDGARVATVALSDSQVHGFWARIRTFGPAFLHLAAWEDGTL